MLSNRKHHVVSDTSESSVKNSLALEERKYSHESQVSLADSFEEIHDINQHIGIQNIETLNNQNLVKNSVRVLK